MIERLFKMLGNISKKKGNNGDFYTKAVVDKKIKDTETATKAYTDKAAADVKNNILTEVGEKVDVIEETVKAKLDSTDTELNTKVDKVEGKGLVDATDIRTAVQNGNLYFEDGKEMSLQCTENGVTGTNVIDAASMTVEYNNMKTAIGCSTARFSFTDTNKNVFIQPENVTINQGGKTVHALSSKANTSDVFLKSDDVVLAKDKIIKVIKDGESTVYDGSTENIQIRGDAIFIRANDVEPYGLTLRKNGITLEAANESGTTKTVSISPSDVTIIDPDSNGYQHKLTEKLSQGQLELYLINSDEKQFYGGISVTRNNDDADIKVIIPGNPNTGVETTVHKLSEKANTSDVILKSGDVVLADGKGIELRGVKDGESVLNVINGKGITISVGDGIEYNSIEIDTNDVVISGVRTSDSGVPVITSHKLSNKVDKVSGKSLIDENVANAITYAQAEVEALDTIVISKRASFASIISSGITSFGDISATNGSDVIANVAGAEGLVEHKLSEKVNTSDVGALSTLATTNKSSIVAAINELKAAIDELKGS